MLATLTNRHGDRGHPGRAAFDLDAGGQAPVVWLSSESRFASGKSLRGGAPVCWPWFGPHPDPDDPAKPAHGFARNLDWEVRETADGDDATRIVLGFVPGPAQQALWPHSAELTLAVEMGQSLKLEPTVRNTGGEAIVLTQALHA